MTDASDAVLLEEFARNGSEAAFAELVSRHVALVYSVAWRHTANIQHAQDITQAVFIILARKARSLARKTVVSGWLYNTARLTAANFRRAEQRRIRREQEAYMQSTLEESSSDDIWTELCPLLDAAMAGLGANDRNAIVLRYFQNKTLPEVGSALGVEERAAQKRVSRALEKLRQAFFKRGVTLSAAMIAGAVSANSVQAAPVGLATTLTATAVKGAAASSSTLAIMKGALEIMTWTKAKAAVVTGAALLLAATTTTVVISSSSRSEREAASILEQTHQKYASLTSYSSTGSSVEEIGSQTLTGAFSMRLGRPRLYRVEYEHHALTFTNKGAAWSDGSGDYFANDLDGKPPLKLPIPGPAHNLGNIVDVSSGIAAVVPGAFFGVQIPAEPAKSRPGRLLSRLGRLFHLIKADSERFVKVADETVERTDCYVLSSETKDRETRLWIGKEDLLIHQSQQRVKTRLTDATDAEVTSMVAGFPGSPPLPVAEMKRRINAARKEATATLLPVTVVFSEKKGVAGIKSITVQPPGFRVTTQTYDHIEVNQPISPADFSR